MANIRAGQWEWYYPDNSKDGESIASITGYSQASVSSMKRHAEVMALEAKAELAMAYHRPEDERSEIGAVHMGQDAMGRRPDLDSVVYLAASDVSENGGSDDEYRAALSIEFGHWTRSYNTRRNAKLGDAEGPIRGRKKGSYTRPKDAAGAKWVPGVAPLSKAAKAMVRKRRMSIK